MRIAPSATLVAGALLGAAGTVLVAFAPVQTAPSGSGAPLGGAPAVDTPASPPPGPLTEQQIQSDTYAAMTLLSRLIGRWDVQGGSFEPDGTQAETFQGAAVFSLALGENFVLGDWTLQSGPYVLEQIDYFGYSPGLRRFTHTMLTQLDKSMVYQQGVWIPESSTLSFTMAAPLDTPRGTPRAVGLEYAFLPGGQIALTMTMQSGAKPPRTVRMMLTPSQEPPAPTGPNGLPNGTLSGMRQAPANMAQMQKTLQEWNAQKQAMQQYMGSMRSQMQQISQQMNSLTNP
jgi:hypothetical protein